MEKRLRRSRDNRVIAGVCAGVAEYVGMDTTLLRLVFAVLAVVSGGSFGVVYLILWAIMPEERAKPISSPDGAERPAAAASASAEDAAAVPDLQEGEAAASSLPPATSDSQPRRDTAFLGWILLAVGVYLVLSRLGLSALIGHIWPLILVVVGVLLLWPRLRKR